MKKISVVILVIVNRHPLTYKKILCHSKIEIHLCRSIVPRTIFPLDHCNLIFFYCRDKKKEFAPSYAAYYPFGLDVFLSQRKIDHIARFVELPIVNSSGDLPAILVVNVQVFLSPPPLPSLPFFLSLYECIFVHFILARE